MVPPRLPARLPRGIAIPIVAACLALGHITIAPGTIAMAEGSSLESGHERTHCDEFEQTTRHVVLFPEGTVEEQVTREIAGACGQTAMYYADIGVAVATSADPEFATRMGPGRTFSAQQQRHQQQPHEGQATTPTDNTANAAPQLSQAERENVDRADRSDEQWNMRTISAERARSVNSGDRDVSVGILDSGIDAAHPDLDEAIDPDLSVGCLGGEPDSSREAWEPSTSAHGTHIAGTVGAAENGAGINGIAPGVTLASIKVLGPRGYADPEAVVCGLVWAAENEITITNSSYVVEAWSPACAPPEEFDVAREAIARAAEYAASSGTLNIAAATNEGVRLSPAPPRDANLTGEKKCAALPADLPSTLAVSAVGPDEVKAGYSSYGLGVITATAPGGEGDECILSTVPGGYTRICGTSMAAPHVTGAAALVASENPEHGPEQIADVLTSTARPLECPADYDISGDGRQNAYCSGYAGYNGFYGHGLIDAHAALADMDQNDEHDSVN